MDTETIAARLARMTPDERRRHHQAMAQGYHAEKCPGCGVVLLAHHHFVVCAREADCPMTTSIPLLDRILT